jgi:hypothetical protein
MTRHSDETPHRPTIAEVVDLLVALNIGHKGDGSRRTNDTTDVRCLAKPGLQAA